MDENKNELKGIKGKSYEMQLVTTKGSVRKGFGMDFDGDKHADVFWYNRIYDNNYFYQKRNTVLYIKKDGAWLPLYVSNSSHFY
jgi:hypothetical protein